MSAANVALVASVYKNFASGDIPAVLAALDPEIDWVENTRDFLPWRGTHHGPAAVVSGVFMAVMDNFDEFAVIPERFHDAGDTVVVEGRAVGVSKTGNRLDSPAAWVWTVRDGKAIANHNFHDTDAIRAALS